jgi:fermentation-respiration switch protein FrsA (DUF1100 family)
MTALKWLLSIAIVGYGGVLGLMYVFQRTLMYFPDPTRTPPVAAGLPQAEEVTLTSGDGEKLVAWYVAPKGAKPVIIYFHGNAGALNLRAGRFKWLIEDGTGLLALAYRGYGGSTDVGAAAYPFAPVRWLIKDPFHSDERIARLTAPLLVLHGERDRIVPIALGEKLFSLAREPKRFVRFPLGGHVDLDDNGAQKAVRTFLNALADRASR